MESDKRIKIEGEGHLINKDSSKRFPVKFEVEQIQTGKISGKCTLSGFEYEDILSPSQLKKCRIISGNLIKINDKMYEFILEYFRNFSLKGETDNRDNVIIKDIFTYSINYSSSRPRTLNLEFSAREVEVVYETISSKDQLWIEYGIINLNLTLLLQGHIETDIGKITFSKWEDHDETIKKIKTFKTPLLSGLLNITDVNIGNFESFDSYLEISNATIEKVLELLSLAQSTYLSYCSICIYAKTPNSNSQDDYKLKRMIMLDIKAKAPSPGQPLIRDWEDIYNFISPKTLQKYTDLRDKCDLDIALEWYLESLSHGVLQSDFLLACTCLELLKDRYNKKIDNEYIIRPKELFDKKYYPILKNLTKNVLKEEPKEIRADLYDNLKGINRTSFSSSLLQLLDSLNISYEDIFPDINIIPKIRNQLTHTGIQEKSTEELSDVYEKLICLIQRIFLALLKYEGYFLNRNDRYAREKFTDFISGG